jgi:hypothetical protein
VKEKYLYKRERVTERKGEKERRKRKKKSKETRQAEG